MKLKSIISIFCCSGFLASLLLGNFFNEDAWGYFYSVRTGCGPGGIIKSRATHLLLNNTSFSDGSSFENAIMSAFNEFNTDIPGSGWQFSWGKDYDSWVGWQDGISEVAFMTGAQIGTNKPAYTKLWYDRDYSWSELCYYIEATSEADVLFNSDYNWTSSLTAEPGRTCAEGEGLCNVKATALHELGHAAGLLHENRWLATMGQGYYAYFGLNRNLPMIHSDDKAGMRFLYGNGTTGRDVAVHAFRQASTAGEYGIIGDVRQSSSVTDAGFPYAFIEYTVENHGTTTETINVGFYVLQNDTWNLLGTTEIPGTPPGFVATYIRYLFIPTSVPNGNYFFKVKTDYGEQISETNELNNEFQLPQLITIYMNRSAPILNPIGNKTVEEGNLLSFAISATDADGDAIGGDPLTYSATNLPSGATFNAATRTFNWTPTTSQAGSNYDVIFTVSDGGFSDEETIRITVTSAGIVVMPSQMISPVPGSTLSSSSVTFQWDSGIGARANYMAVGTTPPDPNSGPSSDIYWVEPMIGSSFTIPNIPLTGQPVYVRLYSNLYDGVKVFSRWNDYVYQTQVPNRAPVINAIGNKIVNEGELLSFVITATDADGDALTYSATNLPAGANFTGNIFTWTPDYSQAWSYSITFTVTDPDGLSDSETIGVTVDDVDRLPVLDPVGNRSVLEGQLLTFTLSATDPDGTPLTYTAPNLPAGATFSGQTFSWTPTYDQVGSYRVAFYVYSGGISDSESIWISVVYNTLPSQMISPVPGSTLNSSSVTFQWDSGIGVGANYMAVGTTPPDPNNGPSSDIYSLSPIVGNFFTIPNIPLTGQPIYVRLYSNLNDGVKGFSKWNDYIYQTTLPTDLSLTNQTINSGVVEHKALNSIIAGQAFVVEGAADVTFKAGAVITLKPGFRAMTGSKFRAVPNLN